VESRLQSLQCDAWLRSRIHRCRAVPTASVRCRRLVGTSLLCRGKSPEQIGSVGLLQGSSGASRLALSMGRGSPGR